MLLRHVFYYDGKTALERGSDAFNWLVNALTEFSYPENGGYISVVSQDLTHATLTSRYFTFSVNGSRRIQISFTATPSLNFSILKSEAPDAPFTAANNAKNTLFALPTNNNPVPMSIILSKYAFLVNRGTTTIVQGFSAKHYNTDNRIMLIDDKIIDSDDNTVYDTSSTTYGTNSTARLPAASPSLAYDSDTLASMPISFTGTTSPAFGFLGYFTEGLLRTSNKNGFVAYSLISVNGVRYMVGSNTNYIYRVDD